MSVPSPIQDSLFVWSEIARNIGILLAGVIGLGIAWWRSRAANLQARAALEQSELARRDHITEIFSKSVDQLASEKLEVRLGAVYSLWAICQDDRYRSHIWPVIETLSAYVRTRTQESDAADMPVDVRAIVDMLQEVTARSRGSE